VRTLIKKFISAAVKNNTIWNALNKTLVRAGNFAQARRLHFEASFRNQFLNEFIQKTLLNESAELKVKNGPFKGMKYPQVKSIGSSFTPKLIGSYEMEIQPIIEVICTRDYTQIIDIGCAEGYYAVGLAMRIRGAKVYAYDLNKEAISLCREMARTNKVSDRVVTGSFCNSETLRNLPSSEKTLIISDCEGYEMALFEEDVIPFLANYDILIETHDFIDIEISARLRERFQGTHLITSIQSCDDIAKAKTYFFPELQGYSLSNRKILLSEERPSIMEWFYLTPQAR